MLRYTTEKDKAYRILDLTSLSVDEFEELVEPFEQAFVRYMQQWTMEGKPRTARAYTLYTNSPLPTPQDRLLFILSYLKVAALQVAHAALFGMSQSNATKWIHVLLVVLQQTLRDLGDAPARHLQALEGRLAELRVSQADAPPLFFTTAPNDQLPAPKIAMSKKRVIAARKSGTHFLSDTYEGSVHDKPIADQTPYPLPEGSELLQDLGFVGFSLDGVQITMPHKKPRGQELTEAQKTENQIISHRRVRVEHIICSIKRCRIVKDTIRLWKDTARDLAMAICCGLHNFRLRLHPWPPYQ